MLFNEVLRTLPELEDYSVEIILDSWERTLVENVEWRQWSLRLLQAFLNWKNATTQLFPIEDFCEYYKEWLLDKDTTHNTINALNKYNEEWGIIKKIK